MLSCAIFYVLGGEYLCQKGLEWEAGMGMAPKLGMGLGFGETSALPVPSPQQLVTAWAGHRTFTSHHAPVLRSACLLCLPAGILCVGLIKQSRKQSAEDRLKAEQELAAVERKREELRQKLALARK